MLYELQPGEIRAVTDGYVERMNELWRMVYFMAAHVIMAPHTDPKMVKRAYDEYIGMAFPDSQQKSNKTPSEMMEEIEAAYAANNKQINPGTHDR